MQTLVGRRVSDVPNENKASQRYHVHSDDRPCLKNPSLDGDFGWTVDDGAVKLNRPSSDFQILSLCDEVLVSWCDVLSSNLSSEEIVIFLVNTSLTSSQAVTQQRNDLSAQK